MKYVDNYCNKLSVRFFVKILVLNSRQMCFCFELVLNSHFMPTKIGSRFPRRNYRVTQIQAEFVDKIILLRAQLNTIRLQPRYKINLYFNEVGKLSSLQSLQAS
ncbi:unnamed protein product [Chrysodeixis includens]|uniref:Uncharacterized protein n=1 Tax=Chrysodeixis includens TaxID=689277 RepID=A0A9N8KT78_CHRIL|nr:unnamed protein product [Chrysodeixis includens]